jgi:hypothetical protein
VLKAASMDPPQQLIITDQLKAMKFGISAGQDEIENNISDIRAGLDKMKNNVQEQIKTDTSDIRAGQEDMKDDIHNKISAI